MIPRPVFRQVSLGAVRPEGWLAERMRRDLDGFVGHLDQLVPDLVVHDDIYGRDRITARTKPKDVGAIMDTDDPAATAQFMWWNSETQSNWRDGWIRHILLIGDAKERERARAYVQQLVDTIDDDGYLGIYCPDLRFTASGENGELWAQATAGRALLAYIEAASDRVHGEAVLAALAGAVRVTLDAYQANERTPFAPGSGGGGAHGLAFTDVLDRLTDLTGEIEFRRAAGWLYARFSDAEVSEPDAQRSCLLDVERPFAGHGVHTYEHLRSLVVAAEVFDDDDLTQSLANYLQKLSRCLTPAHGPIGDEWIAGQSANPWTTGYEFCSIVELMGSMARLMQSTGKLAFGDVMESLLLNAAFGAWHPERSAIAYLQTDNAVAMTGQRADLQPDGVQTRYRYSPTHRQAAVCCVPNAGRLLPTYLSAALQREGDDVVIALFVPMSAAIEVAGVQVEVRVVTQFPDELDLRIEVRAEKPVDFTLVVRMPNWADDLAIDASMPSITETFDDRVRIRGVWHTEQVQVRFSAHPLFEIADRENAYVRFGPRLFALTIPSVQTITHAYGVGALVELSESPANDDHAHVALAVDYPELLRAVPGGVEAPFQWLGSATRHSSEELVTCKLEPLGSAALRRLTFPVSRAF